MPIPPKKQRTWHLQFTEDELAEWRGKTKVCPRCFESKEIIEHFGIRKHRYSYDPPEATRRRICVRSMCFKCASKEAHERMRRNQPEKYKDNLQRLRELDKDPKVRAAKAISRSAWVKANRDKWNGYRRAYWKRHPLRHLARLMANFAYPVRQPCSIEGCKKLGIRHHDDYAKPLEIRWLCPTHHADEHRRLNDIAKLKRASDNNQPKQDSGLPNLPT